MRNRIIALLALPLAAVMLVGCGESTVKTEVPGQPVVEKAKGVKIGNMDLRNDGSVDVYEFEMKDSKGRNLVCFQMGNSRNCVYPPVKASGGLE